MKIEKSMNGTELTLTLAGRLDTTTAPELEAQIVSSLGGVTELIVDLTALEYISSAGLRVLLLMQKTMNKQGSMTVMNINDTVREVFDITGFSDILTIK